MTRRSKKTFKVTPTQAACATNSRPGFFKSCLILLTPLLLFSGCVALTVSPGIDRADAIAAAESFQKIYIKTDPFTIVSYARLKQPEKPIVFYLEGDGLAWRRRNQVSLDPTPRDPMGLKLAVRDEAPNVIYLARPCQYESRTKDALCDDSAYWTNKRFSEEIIASINQAIDVWKERVGASHIHLVGYSGGGAVAVLIAARRDDVLSLKTVAGNLNPQELNRHHRVSPLSGSLDPMQMAPLISQLPQVHYGGEADRVVPFFIIQSFLEQLENKGCGEVVRVPGADHKHGWLSVWQHFARERISCSEGKRDPI